MVFFQSTIDEFLPEFVNCLNVCILHEEKSANVERTLDFSADFAVSFSSNLKEDETCPLLEGVFRFIFNVSIWNGNHPKIITCPGLKLPIIKFNLQ